VATGTVKSFNPKRHFGFIQPDMGGKDVFVHISQVRKSGIPYLRKGQKISFEIVHDQGMPSAQNLRLNGGVMTANKPVAADLQGNGPTRRLPITCDALQSVIAKAVRDSGPQCQAFVGILLEQTAPKSPGDVNWTIRGIKYGKGDRAQCDAAISDIVEQLQREFVISDQPE